MCSFNLDSVDDRVGDGESGVWGGEFIILLFEIKKCYIQTHQGVPSDIWLQGFKGSVKYRYPLYTRMVSFE